MSKTGPNCCASNNVDRTNEVYVLKDHGRFAYHKWGNELQDAPAPVEAAPQPKVDRSARSKGAETRKKSADKEKTAQKIKEAKEAEAARKAEQKKAQDEKKKQAA